LEKQNPLPNTITISKIPLSDYKKLNYIIEWKLYLFWWNDNLNSKDLFSSYSSQYNRINSRIIILNSIILWLYVIIGMFVFAIWVISYSIIWNFIYYYRDEIYITKLVWWSKAFIYGPFSLQGVIYSMIAFLISLWLFYGFIKLGITFDILNITYVFNDIFEKSKYIFLFELLLFMVIWALSWYSSSKKYLN
jgi:cell division protein FtsX